MEASTACPRPARTRCHADGARRATSGSLAAGIAPRQGHACSGSTSSATVYSRRGRWVRPTRMERSICVTWRSLRTDVRPSSCTPGTWATSTCSEGCSGRSETAPLSQPSRMAKSSVLGIAGQVRWGDHRLALGDVEPQTEALHGRAERSIRRAEEPVPELELPRVRGHPDHGQVHAERLEEPQLLLVG